MPELSEFERQRQENIQRNKELLRQLDLDLIHDSIAREVPSETKKPSKRRKTAPKPKLDPEPSRRSRRIAGIKMEDSEEFKKLREEEEERDRRRKEVEKLKQTRLYGNFQLLDLITDRQGNLKFEDKVLRPAKDTSKEVKKEETEEIKQEEPDELEIYNDNEVLKLFRELGDKMSAGDFYEMIRESKLEYTDKLLKEKREEFDKLKVYERFDPLDIKISHQRITSLNFHPSVTDRVIAAGDTNGNLGIWAVDSKKDEEDPTISIIKPHGKSISKILAPFNTPSKFLTASYDGSVRQIDLNKLESSEIVYLNDPYETADYPLGVSDINVCVDDPNILYMTTLSGNFYQHDLRTSFKKVDSKKLLRLHDKKIGSFAINPNTSYQIASASLDRTLRIWDLRNISASNAAWSEFENNTSPHAYGSYPSRLSVSCVDWNADNRLVCNGYDDYVCIFDLSGAGKIKPVTEWSKDYQVPSKKKTEENQIPANLEPFTKIRHNCQTGRWVSILKSKWQIAPADKVQKFVIANMNRGFDIYDQKGQILAHLTAGNVGAVPAVCSLHPTQNWVAGGSASGKIYMFE